MDNVVDTCCGQFLSPDGLAVLSLSFPFFMSRGLTLPSTSADCQATTHVTFECFLTFLLDDVFRARYSEGMRGYLCSAK